MSSYNPEVARRFLKYVLQEMRRHNTDKAGIQLVGFAVENGRITDIAVNFVPGTYVYFKQVKRLKVPIEPDQLFWLLNKWGNLYIEITGDQVNVYNTVIFDNYFTYWYLVANTEYYLRHICTIPLKELEVEG